LPKAYAKFCIRPRPDFTSWRISAGWNQWILPPPLTLPKSWTRSLRKGVGSVTRVFSDPRKDIGLNILSQFHYEPNVSITTFETLADAVQSIIVKADSLSA